MNGNGADTSEGYDDDYNLLPIDDDDESVDNDDMFFDVDLEDNVQGSPSPPQKQDAGGNGDDNGFNLEEGSSGMPMDVWNELHQGDHGADALGTNFEDVMLATGMAADELSVRSSRQQQTPVRGGDALATSPSSRWRNGNSPGGDADMSVWSMGHALREDHDDDDDDSDDEESGN